MAKRELTKADIKFREDFGNQLRLLREKRSWTQTELAAVSNVSEGEISKIERGIRAPYLQSIRGFSFALGIAPAELFNFEIHYRLNTNFGPKKARGPRTTFLLRRLIDEKFFNVPRSVSDVVKKCKTDFGVKLFSDDTSGALLRLVKANVLRIDRHTAGKRRYKAA